jgi:hypothetical protein
MKTIVGVIVALVTFSLTALGLFAAQQLSSPPSHLAAGPAFTDPDEGTIVPPTPPSGSATAPVSAAGASAIGRPKRASRRTHGARKLVEYARPLPRPTPNVVRYARAVPGCVQCGTD